MVEKFQNIIDEINKEHSEEASLFMLLKMDEFQDKWSIFLSALWITVEHRSSAFMYLRTKLLKHLTDEERLTIARIGVFPVDSHETQLFLSNLEFQEVNNGFVRIQNRQINGYKIHDAFIFGLHR